MTVLTIYIDFKSPESYLAFHRTMTYLEVKDLEIIWNPFLTSNRTSTPAKHNETKGETHRRIREEHKKSLNLKYAKILNLPMKYPPSENASDLALSVLPKLVEEKNNFIALAFKYFWKENLDLNDKNNVTKLLKASKIDERILKEEKKLLDKLNHQTELARELGVIATPTYELEGELFLGREHLPWIKERITSINN